MLVRHHDPREPANTPWHLHLAPNIHFRCRRLSTAKTLPEARIPRIPTVTVNKAVFALRVWTGLIPTRSAPVTYSLSRVTGNPGLHHFQHLRPGTPPTIRRIAVRSVIRASRTHARTSSGSSAAPRRTPEAERAQASTARQPTSEARGAPAESDEARPLSVASGSAGASGGHNHPGPRRPARRLALRVARPAEPSTGPATSPGLARTIASVCRRGRSARGRGDPGGGHPRPAAQLRARPQHVNRPVTHRLR